MNSLADLNEYLFAALDAITNNDLSDEQLQREINKAQAVTKISETVIRNGELALKTMQMMNQYNYETDNGDPIPVPEMLEYKPRGERGKNLLGAGK